MIELKIRVKMKLIVEERVRIAVSKYYAGLVVTLGVKFMYCK